MPFTNRNFPGRTFETVAELEDEELKRQNLRDNLPQKSEEIVRVTATIIPASKGTLERKIVDLEKQISSLHGVVKEMVATGTVAASKEEINREGLRIGTILQGESRGQRYTVEAIDKGYLCSDGVIYQSLSGAAKGVSGNRRSGWKFWKDVEGNPIGAVIGRFKSGNTGNSANPFRERSMS